MRGRARPWPEDDGERRKPAGVVMRRALAIPLVALLAALAPAAAAQAPEGDPTLYCEGDGGPLGAATDLEHEVLLGEAPLPAGLRSRRVSVDGVSTRVVEGGPAGADDAVVFVHGSPGSARDFDDLLVAGARSRGPSRSTYRATGSPTTSRRTFSRRRARHATSAASSKSSASTARCSRCTTSAARGPCSGRSGTPRH